MLNVLLLTYVLSCRAKGRSVNQGEGDKEGCNRGPGLSAAIYQGSLEKTVGASLIALWFVLKSLFFVEKWTISYEGQRLCSADFST